MKLILPFPPSVNNFQRNGRKPNVRFDTKEYRDWKQKSFTCLKDVSISEITTPVIITHLFFVPDKRRRDLDNYVKAVTDFIVNNKIIEDDNFNLLIANLPFFGGIDRDNPRVETSIITIEKNHFTASELSDIVTFIAKINLR